MHSRLLERSSKLSDDLGGGSLTALPTWVDFMQVAKDGLEIDDWKTPAGVSYVRVSRDSGKPTENLDEDSYFELFLYE